MNCKNLLKNKKITETKIRIYGKNEGKIIKIRRRKIIIIGLGKKRTNKYKERKSNALIKVKRIITIKK